MHSRAVTAWCMSVAIRAAYGAVSDECHTVYGAAGDTQVVVLSSRQRIL